MAQVTVMTDNDQIVVEGRTAAMVQFLAENQSRVNVAEKGDVMFHFGFNEVSPKITAMDPPLAVS